MQKGTENIILNSKAKDSGSKIIFDDNVLCSQFLRDYVDLPFFKDVLPEDIEDVSEQFVTLFAEERNADRVKKVHIKSEISLVFFPRKFVLTSCLAILFPSFVSTEIWIPVSLSLSITFLTSKRRHLI